MYGKLKGIIEKELTDIRGAGLDKEERVILTPQGADIKVKEGEVINFCANNYLGLADDPALVAAAKESLDRRGYGMASVRFICGTQDIHKELEKTISTFFGTEDTILYGSCFDANGGLFETLFNDQDAIISDGFNHSIIDGVRLVRRSASAIEIGHGDLEAKLRETQGCRLRMIATDGVFSMDGYIAKLDQICDLAGKHDAIVMVDDSHATGFVGKTGRGTPEHCGVMGRVDIVTSTMGKALGGASGGFTTGQREIVELLRQRSRPYLFSNSLAPVIAATTLKVFQMLSSTTALRDKLEENTRYFRGEMKARGFNIREGIHPICPLMLGDARLAADISRDMLAEGIYVVGFSYPVVPKGQARIRVQISAAHTRDQIARAIEAFSKAGRKHGVIPASIA